MAMIAITTSEIVECEANCLRLFVHWFRAAASRTFWTAGSNRPIKMAMIAMTTSNSMSDRHHDEQLDQRESATLIVANHENPRKLEL